MNTNINLRNHIALTASDDLKQICSPLFEFLNINYFAFHRVHDDGSVSRLSTYPEWTTQYVKCNYFDRIRVDQFPSINNAFQYHLWTHYPIHDPSSLLVMQDSFKNFNLKNGFSIIKNYGKYSDQYIFAVKREIKDFDEGTYLMMIEPIERWIAYFLHQANSLISKAESQKFKTRIHPISPINQSHDNIFSSKESDFQLTLEIKGKKICFSSREIDCLSGIIKGKSIKTIARDLNLSPRTVETYMNNIKMKAQCSTKGELTEQIIQFEPLRHYLWNRINL